MELLKFYSLVGTFSQILSPLYILNSSKSVVVDGVHSRQGFCILKLGNPRFVQMSLLAAKQASMSNELESSD